MPLDRAQPGPLSGLRTPRLRGLGGTRPWGDSRQESLLGPACPRGTPGPVPGGAGREGPGFFSTVSHSGCCRSAGPDKGKGNDRRVCWGSHRPRRRRPGAPGLRAHTRRGLQATGLGPGLAQVLRRDQLDPGAAGAGAPAPGQLPAALPSAHTALAGPPPPGTKSCGSPGDWRCQVPSTGR